jgi:cyclin-dependent kinase
MRLKLTDFSHSVMTTTTQRPRSLTATDLSVRAPEVLLGESYPSAPIDMWAAGCAMALMSNGLPLFQGHSVSEQLAKMFEILGTPTCKTWPSIDQLPGYNPHWSLTPIQQPTKQFRHLNEDGIDLVYRMLTLDPDRRITADQALAHPFFRNLH